MGGDFNMISAPKVESMNELSVSFYSVHPSGAFAYY